MAKIEQRRIIKHHLEMAASNGVGLEKENDVRESMEELLDDFAKQVFDTRQGNFVDPYGNKLPPRSVPIERATLSYFGCDFKQFLNSLHIDTNGMTFSQVAKRLGIDNLNVSQFEKMLVEHSSFSNPLSTPNIDTSFRFILPEIFTNAINTGYQHSALHQNWIANTINISQQKVTMPLILRGDGMPSRVNEGANIPVGTIRYSRKDAEVFKVGTGFNITDELLDGSSLDLVFQALQEIGNDMSIGADTEAIEILLNGEQADLSESAPVVGTIDGATFQYQDFKRVFTRMQRLGRPANRIIASEDDTINITSIDRFEGFDGNTRLSTIRSIMGVPEVFDMDTYVLPDNQILYLAQQRCMVKLQYRGMLIETRRNPENQTEELFVSDWIGFAIVARDARVIQDRSITYAGNEFPTYMDIDTRISEAYKAI